MVIKFEKLHPPKNLIKKRDIKIVFISTYFPAKCGIANVTKDLVSAINMLNPNELCRVVALNSRAEKIEYPWEVERQINLDNNQDYKEAIDYINQKKFDVVCLQHEFGIYGGETGEKVLCLAKNIKTPIVTVFHTVLRTPSESQKNIINNLGKKSKFVVVMSQISKKRLTTIYGLDQNKIFVISLGIPDLPFTTTERWKELLGIDNNFLIGGFGLLSPNKGYEYLIKALPVVFDKHPKAIAAIVGETHPTIKATAGEKYRDSLIKLTKDLGINHRVHFLNKYFPTEELTYIVQAMDVFVAPYTDPQQISSAALSLAVGTGRSCVATPFPHAKELLAEGRGIIIPFKNPKEIAKAINFMIENPEERMKMAHSCYLYGRKMTWVKVAESYLDLFRFAKNVYGR